MNCPTTGFTPLKIAALVVGGIALVSHITAVAYPEWDGIDATWNNNSDILSIKSQGSLWALSITDGSKEFFQEKIDTSWKTPIIWMATTGIGAGIVGVGLIVLTALLERCTKNMIVHVCAKMLASTFILCAAFEVLMGAILYRFNFERQRKPDLNDEKHLPFDEHVLKAGFYIECAAGGLFILTVFIVLLDIMYYEGRDTSSVSTSVVVAENIKVKEKAKNIT